ncbi:hypothetical protein PROFUN_16608, partial [Planoprotostelium fungivorum]
QCVQYLWFSCLGETAEEGACIFLPTEKVVRIYGAALPIPKHFYNVLKWYISEIRPILLAEDQSALEQEWLCLRHSKTDPEREEEIFSKIVHHLWIGVPDPITSVKGGGAGHGAVSEMLGDFMNQFLSKSKSTKFAILRRCFASHACDSKFSQEPDFRRAFADYINTSVTILLRNYNRSHGVSTMRRTQDILHQSIVQPTVHNLVNNTQDRFLNCGTQYVNVMFPVTAPVDPASYLPENDNIGEDEEVDQISWVKSHPYEKGTYNFSKRTLKEFKKQMEEHQEARKEERRREEEARRRPFLFGRKKQFPPQDDPTSKRQRKE